MIKNLKKAILEYYAKLTLTINNATKIFLSNALHREQLLLRSVQYCFNYLKMHPPLCNFKNLFYLEHLMKKCFFNLRQQFSVNQLILDLERGSKNRKCEMPSLPFTSTSTQKCSSILHFQFCLYLQSGVPMSQTTKKTC